MAASSTWYQRIFGKPYSSKDIAKERLKLVLLHDRTSLSPVLIDTIKDEIIQVLSKYVEIDKKAMDVELTRINDNYTPESISALVANIPILGVKNTAIR